MANTTKSKEIKDGSKDQLPRYCPERCCRIAAAIARLGNASDANVGAALGLRACWSLGKVN
jgi:hypothetical protein